MQLVTSRLILRDPEPGDAACLAAYQSDARYLEHYREKPDAGRIIATALDWARASPRRNFQLVVTLKEGGTVIGCAGVRQAGRAAGEADVGIELDPDHWGAGYAREALAALSAFAFGPLGARRLVAETTPGNAAARRLLSALGFTPLPSPPDAACFELRSVDTGRDDS